MIPSEETFIIPYPFFLFVLVHPHISQTPIFFFFPFFFFLSVLSLPLLS
jgi:hypothetical protein